MSLCPNCKFNIQKYSCEICNCSYCIRCDSYIHSFPTKRSHLRRYITINNLAPNIQSNIPYLANNSNLNSKNNIVDDFDKNEEQENLPYNDNIPVISDNNEKNKEQQNIFFYSQSKFDKKDTKEKNEEIEDDKEYNKDYYKEYDKEYEYEYENEYDLNNDIEQEIFSKKISNLGSEIMDAKENFDNKIEDLHEYFLLINENQRAKMNELNEKNLKEINMISNEKDIQVQRLKEILEEQIEIINQLRDENNNLKNIYDENKKEIESLNFDKLKLIEENKKIEETNMKKISEIMAINEQEKAKLISDYNEELLKIKNKYDKTEEQFENTFKEKQRIVNDYIEEIDKEKNDLSIMINSLIADNKNKNKETEKLKEKNEELGKIYNEREGQYKSMKEVVANGTKKNKK